MDQKEDRLAKCVLIAVYGHEDYTSSDCLHTPSTVQLDGTCITDLPQSPFENNWGYKSYKTFFH